MAGQIFKIPTTTAEYNGIIQSTIDKMIQHINNRNERYVNLSLSLCIALWNILTVHFNVKNLIS